jgi:hypothetical protein
VSNYQKAKEGKPAAAGQSHLCEQTFISDIVTEVENDRQDTHLSSWGNDQTGPPTHNKDLKLSKKSARWLCQLKEKEMEKEQV